jgi:hypothetical protein
MELLVRGCLVWLGAVCIAGCLGCSREPAPVRPARMPAVELAVAVSPELVAVDAVREGSRVPKGRWRLAPPEELDHTLLWLSHVLIRHAEVDETQIAFTLTGWRSTEPLATRPRSEARLLAQRIAQTARERGHFAELARRYSEDPSTRERGGSLGGVAAGHLSAWPQVIDALEKLQPGEVSDAVETPFGYHVLYRRPPVPLLTVSGAHIVIAHADAPWIALAARGEVPARSRAEALALARRLFEQARARPDQFAQLVEAWSEHRDAARSGDFGTWSTHEISGLPREIETLAQLQVGEVAEPIDTLFGYQVIQRTPNRVRDRYAMQKIQLRFDPERADGAPGSKSQVYAQARDIAARLRSEPASFAKLQQQHCCPEVWEIIEGRQLPALEQALARLSPGQIAPEPIEDVAVEYLIPQRLELGALPPARPTRFELPVAHASSGHLTQPAEAQSSHTPQR